MEGNENPSSSLICGSMWLPAHTADVGQAYGGVGQAAKCLQCSDCSRKRNASDSKRSSTEWAGCVPVCPRLASRVNYHTAISEGENKEVRAMTHLVAHTQTTGATGGNRCRHRENTQTSPEPITLKEYSVALTPSSRPKRAKINTETACTCA